MPVSRSRYNQLRAMYEHEAERRRKAENLAAERLSTITRMAGELDRLRDAKPDSPLQTGNARLRQLLHLSEKARRALDADRSELIAVNVQLTRELHELRDNTTEGSTA